ncbi:hypothetical protein NCL57_002058 [Salmonella enterica]|nr:hypothetical protein [Salmonella enterica]EJH1052204.1 hypothetical protein [Salmonella enterica]
MSQMKVKAAPGVKVPREENARRYITSDADVTVEDSAYYRRQISAGDLILVTGTDNKKAVKIADKPDAQEVNSVQS